MESRRTNDVFDVKEALLRSVVCHGEAEVSRATINTTKMAAPTIKTMQMKDRRPS